MRIAILGGGFAGLSVAWFLLHYSQGSCRIDLFDPDPIVGGASGLSSGLLHAYAGKYAKQNWQAEKSLKETHRLITAASQAISQPLIISKGILRPALSAEQIQNFKNCSKQHTDTEWWDKERCESAIEGLTVPDHGGGLFIKDGLTLDVPNYLKGLWQACTRHGSMYHHLTRITAEDLAGYDKVVISMGVASRNFPPLKNLPLTPIKGQILTLKWPEKLKPLPYSLISQKYIVMSPDHQSCTVGATFERHFEGHAPSLEIAKQEILPQIFSFYPQLEGTEVLSVKSAFRASTPNHLPLVGKLGKGVYFFAGLGSKGLLYHGWVGKQVARAVITDDDKHLPEPLYYKL